MAQAVSGSGPGAWCRAAARAVRLGCPGAVLAYSIAQKRLAFRGYHRRSFNRLDGRTARRMELLQRLPQGCKARAGEMCPNMLLTYPPGQAVFRRGAAGLSGRIFRPEPTPRRGLGDTHYMHS